jgi:hypothetical protein
MVHRGHGTVTYKASAATEAGYDLRVGCGQAYYVYVTPEIAADDFLAQAKRHCWRG